jgi:hypothetical protein
VVLHIRGAVFDRVIGSNPITDDRTIDPMHELREVLAVTGYSPEHASLSRG